MTNYYTLLGFTIETTPEGKAFLMEQLENNPPCQYTEEAAGLHFYSEENAELETLALLVQRYLKRFSPDAYQTIQWANTASRIEDGAFGGGVALVTAERILWLNAFLTPDMLPRMAAQLMGVDRRVMQHLPDIMAYALSALSEVDNDEEVAFRRWLENAQAPGK